MAFGNLLFLAGFGLVTMIVYSIGTILYNIFLHPLRRFPGPFWMRATRIAFCHRLISGTLPHDMLALHKKYGNIVRIAPNELAFNDPAAWTEIMGHRVGANKGQAEFEKFDPFYRPLGGPTDVVSSKGEEHAKLRRLMSHNFSARSLKEQEPLIMKYVDTLIQRLHENCDKPVNMMAWYNFTTFDLIGDLAFGEPFGCLSSSDYHPWVRTIFEMARLGTVFLTASYYPVIKNLLVRILSSKAARLQREKHVSNTREKLLRRIEVGKAGGRPDLIDNLIKKKDDVGMTMDDLSQNAAILIVAGSETTATVLSGVTYLLLKNPEALKKLAYEVRTTFKSENEINSNSVNQLSFMLACLEESLRMYPPVPGGLPRVTPKGGATVAGETIPEDTIVAVHQWSMYNNEKNWKDPMKYHPERFMGDPAYADDCRHCLQPFHIGPRNCLGRNLAYVEIRIILARVIWNFDLSLAPESEDWLDRQKIFILWDKGPLMVNIKPVQRS